jgi:cytochrome c-type biogenesis protein CcmH
MNRRRFLAAAAALPAGLLAQQQGGEPEPNRLTAPDMAGRARDSVTDYQNDPYVIGIERRLRCTCGCNLDVYTCRTTDFTCSFSPNLHREVVALHEEGKSAQEILDAFVVKYGETALMAPRAEGFNWAGYLLPGVAIALAGGTLGWVVLRRQRLAPMAVDQAGSDALSPADRDRLAAELERLEP